ncbi:hypothetical protein LCGC14_0095420 [marine sediment metagenome]|uniref:Glycoside hydrolase family 38 central domain-containing protein n=1 Tax=marine sediment metagenome TaxID=412755 RepID=A0A0F9VHS6_9ZZZZ|nr:hypothetical protein [Phycisphaerae bacterium]HDZ45127.1 hypothetical protein [Phycisphaerae bacterium]
MSDTSDARHIAEIFDLNTLLAADAAWARLLARRGIPADQADFGAVTQHDILAVFGHNGSDGLPELTTGVLAGFLYRDHDGDGRYDPGEAITATLLGLPTLTGAGAAEIHSYGNCFWFGPLTVGQTYTLTYDVDGVEAFSQEVTIDAGLNLLHVPVEPTKTLVYIVPHSHFDPEWRNTYEGYLDYELPQLIDRLHLLRRQPEHCFNMDEECVVRPLVKRHPELVEEFRRRVAEGMVEIKGTITAGELTMPLGESMIRQMTEGDLLISRLLGMELRPTTFWNIDCYGINFQLPQILAKAGRKYFVMGEYNHYMGAKIVPSDLPFSDEEAWKHPEFWLQGLDGSKVLIHHSPYGTEPRGPQFFNEKVRSHQSVFNFEGGDFCPPRCDLPDLLIELNDPQRAAKYENLTDTWGRPVMTRPAGECTFIIATGEQFFRAIERADDLPTIRTESRIGFWTGAYESRACGRLLNRQVEGLLLTTESLATAAMLAGMDDVCEDLREAWYLLLINQHHDPQLTAMGPGLFDEVLDRYVDSRRIVRTVCDRSVAFLASAIRTDQQDGHPVVVFNPLAWSRAEVIDVPLSDGVDAKSIRVVDANGKEMPAQLSFEPNERVVNAMFLADEMPGAGWRTYYLQLDGRPTLEPTLTATKDLLENEHVRVELDKGLIQKIVEKSSGRCLFEATDAAAVNEVFIWQDDGCVSQIRPVDFMDSARLVCRSSQVSRTAEVIATGPARAILETRFEMDWGAFRQLILLDADAHWVDFVTIVDWRPAPEGGRRVRVAFPSTLTGADVWRDIPFAVQPWRQSDEIQPINSWLGIADAEGTIGAAMVHTGMCSQQVRDDCLWQTLFRSVRLPGDVSDNKSDPPCGWDLSGDKALEEGTASYVYRLAVFSGSWRDNAVPRLAMELIGCATARTTDRHAGRLSGDQANLQATPHEIVVSAWKKADHSDATIVRLYNPTGDSIDAALEVGFPVASAEETDFREIPCGLLQVASGQIALSFGPYEIKTVRLIAHCD